MSNKSQGYTPKKLKSLVEEEVKSLEQSIAYTKKKGEKQFKTLLYPVLFDGVRSHFQAAGYETEEYDDNTSDCLYSYLIIKWK
jgi:hypothetical protein